MTQRDGTRERLRQATFPPSNRTSCDATKTESAHPEMHAFCSSVSSYTDLARRALAEIRADERNGVFDFEHDLGLELHPLAIVEEVCVSRGWIIAFGDHDATAAVGVHIVGLGSGRGANLGKYTHQFFGLCLGDVRLRFVGGDENHWSTSLFLRVGPARVRAKDPRLRRETRTARIFFRVWA